MKPTNTLLGYVLISTIASLFGATGTANAAEGKSRIELKQDDDAGQLGVWIDGKEAFVYQYGEDADLPHYYPVRSPAGESMTVQKTEPFPHHRSFWFADRVKLGDGRPVNTYGALYTEAKTPDAPTRFRDGVRHVETTVDEQGESEVVLSKKLLWYMDHDTPVLDESRKMRVVALGDGEYFLDVTFTVTAGYGDVTFVSDATHYAWPYVRMNGEFNVQAGGGKIVNSEGGVNQQGTNGKVARWIDYSNTTGEKNAGLAIFSHPDNPQPHQWLTRDYGCFGPRRIDERSGKPFTLEKGQSLKRRVGVLVHRGDVETGRVAERYEQYARGGL